MNKIEKKLRKIAKYATIAADMYKNDKVLKECQKKHLTYCISNTKVWKMLGKLEDTIDGFCFDFGMHHINQMSDTNYNRSPHTCNEYKKIAKKFGITEDPDKTYF